jgi:Zn-dependent peptidase ImmA (M78 family)
VNAPKRSCATITSPVPIEQIVEFGFEMDIIPMPGFHRNYDVDAFISTDLTEIRVDQAVYEAKNKNRYRFSLAHELSHRILHESVFRNLRFRTVAEWKESRTAIPEREYSRLEFQANTLAGLILVPPRELAERFATAKMHAESVGISLIDARPEAWDNIERWLAGEFQVSQGVIARRAPKDGLWELEGM